MYKTDKQYEILLNKLKNGIDRKINILFNAVVEQLAVQLSFFDEVSSKEVLHKSLIRIRQQLTNDINAELKTYSEKAISLSQRKNEGQITSYVANLAIPKKTIDKWVSNSFNVNIKQLSKRVWKLSDNYFSQIEILTNAGLFSGLPAIDIAKELKGFLRNPNRLDKSEIDLLFSKGKINKYQYNSLLKKVADYKPGRGVYKSSLKNAHRLVRTEINMAYRKNDSAIRSQLPFVIGIEVKLSSAHPRYDICFTSWNYKIQTSKGEKNIKDIKINDLVLTHKGRFRKVIKLFKTTTYEVKKTELFYQVNYDNRTKTKKIAATSNHPFLINGKWTKLEDVKEGDNIKIIAVRCKTCNKKIPYYRQFCSKSCASKEITKNQWKSEKHRKKISDKRNKLIKENNGIIPYFKNWIASGENLKNLLKPETIKKAKENAKIATKKMLDEGTHPFQNPKNREKGAKKLGNSKNKSYIEKKIEWLLKELKIEYKTGELIYRDAYKESGQRRYYLPDFVLTKYKIIIEADGDYWHSKTVEYDLKRQKELEKKGYIVLRFKGSVIRENLKSVSDEIQRVVYNHESKFEFMEYSISKVRHYTQKQKTPITKWNFEVEEDNSYIVNGVVVHNCDDLQGKYPKDFVFSGWHPQCICYSTAIMISKEDFAKQLANEPVKINHIKKMPKRAKNYIKKKATKIRKMKTTPFFIQDNKKFYKDLL